MRVMPRGEQDIGLGQIGHCSKRVLGLHAICKFYRYMPHSKVQQASEPTALEAPGTGKC